MKLLGGGLEQLRGAALAAKSRSGEDGFRLIVPTATMAEHVRNLMAREGFLLRPGMVATLSKFIEPWVEGLPQISAPLLYLLVDEVVLRLKRPEFTRVAHLPGFGVALARMIEEFSAAGCDPQSLAEFVEETQAPVPLGAAFAAVYREVEIELIARGAGMRATRLRRAAAVIRRAGAGAVKSVWLEGFYRLNAPERELVDALAKHAAVTVASPSTESVNPDVRTELFTAPVIEREADEIARRILEQTATGREFREIGVVVRNPDVYAPLLAATFERFGIPARFYSTSPLSEHGVTRYLTAAGDAMRSGWDHAATLSAMRMEASGGGVSGAMDRFDFEVRRQLPGRGIEALREIAAAGGDGRAHLTRLLDSLANLDTLRLKSGTPREWTAHMRSLAALAKLARPADRASWSEVAVGRGRAEALHAFESAMDDAAESFPNERVPFEEFWRRAKSVLRLTPLRVADHRRNVVHVMSAHEARQWELPVVFVCGLLEGQFPKHAQPDPFFGDRARLALNAKGIAVRTPAELEQEETLLFHIAVTRATSELVLSYPEMDARGDRNLPSLFLDRFAVNRVAARPVSTRPLYTQHADAHPRSPGFGSIRDEALLKVLAERHSTMKPTGLESFLQCPFQFFGSYTLKLRPAPPRPEDRLDFRVQGTIIHRVLAEWTPGRPPIEPLFGRIFEEVCAQEHVPSGYRREALRQQLLQDLLRIAADNKLPEAVAHQTEVDFEEKIGGVMVRGRIDRIDRLAGGRSLVVDYKYSLQMQKYVKNDNSLQGPLYTIAAERLGHDVAGMLYCGVRGGTRENVLYTGWTDALPQLKGNYLPLTDEWLDDATAKIEAAAGQIREGRVAPKPFSTAPCRYCDFRDVCRYEAEEALTAGGGTNTT